jgi:hypothetical protein
MTTDADLERSYRRWLKWYPAAFRREHEEEILGVLLAGARDGQRRLGLMECLDLASNGLRMRLRPTLPQSHRSARLAVQLMYAGAVLELGAAITVLATLGDVRSSVFARNPGYTEAQWGAEVASQFEPLVAAAGIAAVFGLWMAWASGRGHRWAKIVFAMFFGLNALCLVDGLGQGSAQYAQADVAIGITLCLVQFVAVVLVFPKDLRTISVVRTGAMRVRNRLRG